MSSKSGAVVIHGPIGDPCHPGSVWVDDVIKQLGQIDGDEVLVSIDSKGGAGQEAIAIYAALRACQRRVVTRIESRAESAASVIAMAGDRVEIARDGWLMLHGACSWVYPLHRLRHAADELDQLNVSVAEIYAAKTGRSIDDELANIQSRRNSYYMAVPALACGYVDAIVDPLPLSPAKPA